MNRLFGILLVVLVPLAALAAERPDWAFVVTDKVQSPRRDDGKPKTAPGSSLSLTRAQIDDLFNPPDWYPNLHPKMPDVVAHGDKARNVRACAACHLPTGTGHDESAYLAGLPVKYIVQQIADYKSGDRKGSAMMVGMAKTMTDEEIRAAADYFASLKPRPWIRVVEADVVPKTYIAKGNMRLVRPDGGSEPIGARIIEVPENEDIVLNRDPRSGFVAYVPKGSIARGKGLVTTGGGRTLACAICHRADLRSVGDVPGFAGHHPDYIVRQLWSMQNGERVGRSAAPMKAVVARLTVDDMLAIAAYAGSLAP